MAGKNLLKNEIIGHLKHKGLREIDLVYYDSTDSTNLRAREWARAGGGDAVFVAASQSAGRGRLGRSFLSKEGGIYISFLVHPEKEMSDPSGITAEAAVKLCRAIELSTGVACGIKWVNDLYINGKKVSGILTEGEYDEKGDLSYYVVGMGINVYKIEDFDHIMPIATTIEDNAKSEININSLCAEIISGFMSECDRDDVLMEYRERCFVIGREVTAARGGEERHAHVLSVMDDYTLKVAYDGGEIGYLSSGEISLKL